tara:strand:+ start:83 stop:619 length:537 start_codon:yes stop_codon:yes gene_type:complete
VIIRAPNGKHAIGHAGSGNMKLLIENWRAYIKESPEDSNLKNQIDDIMRTAANMRLMTGAPGQRNMRPEWENVLQALDDIALNVSGASSVDIILMPAYRDSIKSRMKMSFDQLDKLETAAQDNTVKLLQALSKELKIMDGEVPQNLIDAFLKANEKISVERAKPVGKFRADTLGSRRK